MIGTHVVTLAPDPSVPVWSAPIASNPGMDADIAGWRGGVGVNPWTWAAPGVAKPPADITGSAGLFRDSTAPVPRDDQDGLYRVRTTVTLTAPDGGWIIPGIFFATSAQAAHDGPFWYPDDAVSVGQWIWVGVSGTYAVETTVDPSTVDPRYTFLGPYCDFFARTTLTPVNVDRIELTRQTYGETIDITCLIEEVAIRHGRAETTGQPEASTATLDLSLDTDTDDLPDGLDVSSRITVTTTIPGLASTRFDGVVTDVHVGWEDAGEETPELPVVQVIATGDLGELGRRVVGEAPYPQEPDGARVARILSASGIQTDPAYVDAGTVQVLARDVDAQPALALAQSVAQSAGGVLWQTRAGRVQYADAAHRKGAQAQLRLDACDILVTPVWLRNIDGFVNDVTVTYGVAPEGGQAPTYREENTKSKTRFGRFEASLSTVLAELADAQSLAGLLLARNSSPVWVLSALPVHVAGLDAADTTVLLSMDVHDLLEVTGLPSVGSVPTGTSLWVEGWTERLAYGVHELLLNVSGFCRTAPPPEWDRVPPAWTWDSMGTSVTWDDASCFGPIQSFGRWVDVPASTKWNQLTPSQTWDTFTGETVPTN